MAKYKKDMIDSISYFKNHVKNQIYRSVGVKCSQDFKTQKMASINEPGLKSETTSPGLSIYTTIQKLGTATIFSLFFIMLTNTALT